jgi:putative restriction endonuclease
MKAFVGVTDNKWFNFLASSAWIDEVNFWQPEGGHLFGVLNPGYAFY